jgi:hypothetical protein
MSRGGARVVSGEDPGERDPLPLRPHVPRPSPSDGACGPGRACEEATHDRETPKAGFTAADNRGRGDAARLADT